MKRALKYFLYLLIGAIADAVLALCLPLSARGEYLVWTGTLLSVVTFATTQLLKSSADAIGSIEKLTIDQRETIGSSMNKFRVESTAQAYRAITALVVTVLFGVAVSNDAYHIFDRMLGVLSVQYGDLLTTLGLTALIGVLVSIRNLFSRFVTLEADRQEVLMKIARATEKEAAMLFYQEHHKRE